MSAESDPGAGPGVLPLWREAVGRVFKLVTKPYGERQVTYTLVRSVREPGPDGSFDIDVSCVDIIARVTEGKRTYSNISKEGMLHQEADGWLPPESFGVECPRAEFDKVTEAILAYTNTYLEWVIQDLPEERTASRMPVDVVHLRLSAMEASLVRHSPFLAGDLYFLTPNAIEAGLASIRQEMACAGRSVHLVDAVDPVYVEEKNQAATLLRTKLERARTEATQAVRLVNVESGLRIDSLCLALLGRPSATMLNWITANPSEEGVVAGLGLNLSPLEFVRWAHVSGRQVPAAAAAGRNLRDYFRGWNHSYTGPDADGIYPLLKPATD
ncbi:hypothetical protein Verru16b_00174 [Lacunisphaera limnophila]|uniref:Uncharacterized protein n=1 Tax=Lacunisphaera limnophila TaxID=1838286 RepID=A0A1I7PHP4_9BACT|nr:hypothetical protein [Lacunisphaera limnophila]AOS43133.1 hypothetical protein Verru16b_00174 [Lacunisphaera limnophila]